MPVISFSVFKEKILNGTKLRTTRPYKHKRFTMFKKSQLMENTVQLYWKLRYPKSKGGSEHLFDTTLKDCEAIKLWTEERGYWPVSFLRYYSHEEVERYCGEEGFESWDELVEWFTKKHGEEYLKENWFFTMGWRFEDAPRK